MNLKLTVITVTPLHFFALWILMDRLLLTYYALFCYQWLFVCVNFCVMCVLMSSNLCFVTAFGQSSNSPFGTTQPVFGQTSNVSNSPFAPKPFGSPTTPFGAQTGSSIFGGTSTGMFGTPQTSFSATSAFGSSTPAFGASTTPAFGGSSASAFGGKCLFLFQYLVVLFHLLSFFGL